MEEVTKVLSTFAAWATSISVILAALSAICKPVRDFFIWLFKIIFGNKENEILKELKEFEWRIDKKIEEVSSKVDIKIDTLSDKVDEKIKEVAEKVDENERGRLRQEIFNYGNKARKHEKIDGEHFRYLQECFHKYHDELKGNSIAMDEYLFVEKYYNNSGWENVN